MYETNNKMIIGKKIFLNAVEKDDLEQLLKWRNDANNRRFYREYRELSMEQQLKWYETRCVNDDSWNYFAVCLKQDPDKMIGYCGLIYVDKINKSAESAFEIGDLKYRTEEYILDVLETKLTYAFDNMNLNRVWMEVFEDKYYDAKEHMLDYFYEKLGFCWEGTKRDVAFKDGKYVSSKIYAALREDWKLLCQ